MTTPPGAADEARDPGTSPERLLALTQQHPELHADIVRNPSCPEPARSWILATNPEAAARYGEGRSEAEAATDEPAADGPTGDESAADDAAADQPADEAELEETQLSMPPVAAPSAEEASSTSAEPTEPAQPTEPAAPVEPAASSEPSAPVEPLAERESSRPVVAPLPADLGPATEPQEPVRTTGKVRVNEGSGVVPLPASPRDPSPLPPKEEPEVDAWHVVAPAAAASAPAPRPTPTTAMPVQAAAPQQPQAAQQQAPQQQPVPPQQAPAQGVPAAAGAAGWGTAAGSESPVWGGAGQAPPPEDGDRRGRRRTWFACGGCLLLALILLVVGVLVGKALLTDDSGSYSREESPSASTSASPSEKPTTEAETTPSEDPVSPAPDDAIELSAIRSPTGNITCSLDGDTVGCSVQEHKYGQDLEGCADGPFSISVAGEDATPDCSQTWGGSGTQTLEYGSSAKNGDVACTSRSDGMTCWNQNTGKGFTVSRSGYDTF